MKVSVKLKRVLLVCAFIKIKIKDLYKNMKNMLIKYNSEECFLKILSLLEKIRLTLNKYY